jgi:hypothetical protein
MKVQASQGQCCQPMSLQSQLTCQVQDRSLPTPRMLLKAEQRPVLGLR